MKSHRPKTRVAILNAPASSHSTRFSFDSLLLGCALLLATLGVGRSAQAQVNVVTAHNDIARTGQNLGETTLTPQTVASAQFGKLFSQTLDGAAHAQPLYVSQVAIPGKGSHNVVYVATLGDSVYAFDADTNGGTNAAPLWKAPLLTNTSPAGALQLEYGIIGTPVIDLPSNTMYVVSSEEQGYRLHALDITTGAEKLGGPVAIQGSVPGTGSGSTGGVLTFTPEYQRQRAGLLLLNGILYVPFGSTNDTGPWHGWIFSYNAATLQPINTFCTAANGSGGGIWMGGAGLAADVPDPVNKPFGRMFVATGNGTYAVGTPYDNTMSYSMSLLNLDLTGGIPTVQDTFTPFNEALLNGEDADFGSGGPVLLPAGSAGFDPLIQVGKTGTFYILNRDNLGAFNATTDQVVQKVQTPTSGKNNWGAGIWGSPAYWNQSVYFGGTNPGASNPLTAYSFVNGVLSAAPTSRGTYKFGYPSPTPSISSNGANGGIIWAIDSSAYHVGPDVLVAVDASNLANQLYSSNTNLSRDNPGGATTYTAPTIANGKVYVGAYPTLSVYGLLNTVPTAAAPTFSSPSGTFAGSQTIAISDATTGAQIYYTNDGTKPTVNSNLYTGPITITSSQTLTAIASAQNFLQSPLAAATYTATTNAANPAFSLASGTYSGTQIVSISEASPGATVYYTLDGSTPTTSSMKYTSGIALSVPVSETIQAFATAPGLAASTIVSASYDIDPVYTFNFSQGFAEAQGPIQFNGSTDLDDFRLQLTNGGQNEAGSAFYATPVNIQAFTTDFTFQLSNPAADGFTFTIQNAGPGAVGADGGSLGYAGINKSVAIKFDLYSNSGEGPNSTGIYTNGAAPILPAISLVGTGIDLHNGNYTNAHLTYDGTALTITITNPITLYSWSHSFVVNIPAIVGGPTAYVGFTGGSGGLSSSQKLTSWTYTVGAPVVPSYPAGFDGVGMTLNGAALAGTTLQLTNGGANQTTSAYFSKPVAVAAFASDFDFQFVHSVAHGFTFVLQNSNLNAVGTGGADLGFTNIGAGVAIKFDIFNNSGEGTDSTGVYLNGAVPTVPAIDLTSSGVILNSGDLLHAHITYDGTTLTWIITDKTLTPQPSVTNSVTINIPHVIGGNVAYAGFTAASGGSKVATQNILNWTITPQ